MLKIYLTKKNYAFDNKNQHPQCLGFRNFVIYARAIVKSQGSAPLQDSQRSCQTDHAFSPDLAPCDIFRNLRSSYLVDRWYKSRQTLGFSNSQGEFVSLKLGLVLNQFVFQTDFNWFKDEACFSFVFL